MFDPELWKRTRVSAISLVVLGTALLIPAGYVFFLAGVLVDAFGLHLDLPVHEAALFWSALTGSGVGVLAWMAICILLFQRRDIRLHRLTWQLVRLAGIVITLCLGVWFWNLHASHSFHVAGNDKAIFLGVLLTITAAALVLVWLGHRNLGFVQQATQRASQRIFADSEGFRKSTP